MTVIDFDALQAAQGPRVVLLPGTLVGRPAVGEDLSDFSGFDSVYISGRAQLVHDPGQGSLVVLLEQSDDGESWETAETFTLTGDNGFAALLSAPKAHLRASAEAGGGSDWQIVQVTAAPTYLDPANGGSGSGLSTPDASGDTDSITIRTGDSSAGDAGDVLIEGGDGDDSDGDVLIQGVMTVRKNGVQVSKSFAVDYASGSLEVIDSADIGARAQVIGIMIINRTSVPDAYPDTGANYILIVSDPETGHAWGVTPAGYEYFDNPTGIGAPDDADLNSHQRRQWYDPTTGAPAFRFKQKDAAGTVTTGKSAAMADDGSAFLGVAKQTLGATPTVAEIRAALVALGLVTA